MVHGTTWNNWHLGSQGDKGKATARCIVKVISDASVHLTPRVPLSGSPCGGSLSGHHPVRPHGAE